MYCSFLGWFQMMRLSTSNGIVPDWGGILENWTDYCRVKWSSCCGGTPALLSCLRKCSRLLRCTRLITPKVAGAISAWPRRDGQAEWIWVAYHIPRWFTCPQSVTHPSTNRDGRWVTSLIEARDQCVIVNPPSNNIARNHITRVVFLK